MHGDDATARGLDSSSQIIGKRQQNAGAQAIRVRLLGRYQPAKFAAYGGNPEAKVSDVRHPGTTTEFWVPDFNTCAIIDLEAMK